MIAFLIIQLPPGDYLTVYRANQQALGRDVDEAELAAMGKLYGLDKPVHVQYAVWIWRIARGNLGWSFNLKEKVGTLIADRLPFTVLLSLSSLLFAYVIAIPDRHLLRHPPVLDRRLLLHLHGVRGPGDAQLPARADLHAAVQPLVRLEHRRAVLAGVRGRAVELGAGARPAQAHADPGAGDRHRRHRLPGARECAARCSTNWRGST